MSTLKNDLLTELTKNNLDLTKTNNDACPCCSGKSYQHCCEPLHQEKIFALSAEQLMRSRFSAFSLGLVDYLKMTWDKNTCPKDLAIDKAIKWTKLSINDCKKGSKKDQQGWVTFVAYYEANGTPGALHEKSYFIKDTNGHWRYVDGELKNS